MALKLFVIDDVTGNCDLRELVPYTQVTSNDSTVIVTGTTDPVTGQPSYDLSASVDINVDNLAYDPVTKILTLTETDGTTHPINLSDLVDVETVTTLVPDGSGGFNYTSENGTVTNIPAATAAPIQSVVAQSGIENVGTASNPILQLDVTRCDGATVDPDSDSFRVTSLAQAANEQYIYTMVAADVAFPTVTNDGVVRIVYDVAPTTITNPLSCPAIARIDYSLVRMVHNPSLAAGQRQLMSGFFRTAVDGIEVGLKDYYNEHYSFEDLVESGGPVINDGQGFSSAYANPTVYAAGASFDASVRLTCAISTGSDGSTTFLASSRVYYEVTWIAV